MMMNLAIVERPNLIKKIELSKIYTCVASKEKLRSLFCVGIFSHSLKANEETLAKHIKKTYLNNRPNKRLKKMLKFLKYKLTR